MATEKLEIVVGADVQEVVQKLDQISKVAKTSMESTATSFEPVKKALKKVQVEAFDTDKAFREAMDRISSTVDKNIDNAIKSFHALDKSVDKTARQVKTLQDKFREFGGISSNNAAKGLEAINKAAAQTSAELPKLTRATGQSTQTLVNFGRVVQDAPFGIIGIANNIDPLISSFAALRASTGSAGAAFKALAGSLIGPAGIAIAISAITSLMVVYAQKQQRVKKETEDATKDTDSYVRKLSEQKTEITALVKLAQDESQAQETRTRALQKLNDIIPDTIGKLTQQNIAIAQGANIIREYVKALEAQATAELLVGRIAENNVKLFDNRTNTLKEVDRINKEIEATEKRIARQNQAGNFAASAAARQKIIDLENERTRVQEKGRVSAAALIADNSNIRISYEKLLPAAIQIEKLSTDRTNKLKEEVDILKEYKEALRLIEFNETALGIDLLNEKVDIASKTFQDFISKGINPQSAAFQRVQTDLNKYLDTIKQIPKIQEQIQKNLDPTILNKPPKTNPINIQKADRTSALVITPEALQLQGEYLLKIDEMVAKLKLLQQLGDVAMSGLNAGIDQFFNALANNQDPFEALTQSVKRLIVELAAAVVKALVLKAVTAAFTSGGSSLLSGLAGTSVIRGQDLRLLTFLRG